MITMQEDLLLTLEEAAMKLRVSTNTARKYITQGDLQGIRVGGRWKVKQSAIDRYLTRNSTEDKK